MLVNSLNVVFCKKLHIGAQNVKIGKSCKIVGIVGGVVPNIDVVTNFTPSLNGLAECGTSSAAVFGKGMREVTGDGRKANANVGSGLCNFGRILCVLICQRINGYVGIIDGDIVGDSVYKAEERAGGATFLGGNCRAIFTLAIVVVVVLIILEFSSI